MPSAKNKSYIFQQNSVSSSIPELAEEKHKTAYQLRTELEQRGIDGVDEDLLRELSEDNISDTIIEEEIEKFNDDYDLRAVTCRQKLIHFLHSKPVEIFLITMVLLDTFVILGLVVLDMYIVEETVVEKNLQGQKVLKFLKDYCPDRIDQNIFEADNLLDAVGAIHAFERYGGRNPNSSDILSRARRAPAGDPLQDGVYSTKDKLSKVSHVLHFMSVTILGLLTIEVFLKMYGYGCKYFTHKMEVVDGVIVIISFTMDCIFSDPSIVSELGKTVIIIFLMWRCVRIINAMVLTSRVKILFRVRVLRKAKKQAEERARHYDSLGNDLRNEIRKLRGLAKDYGAPEHEIYATALMDQSNLSSAKASIRQMMTTLLSFNSKMEGSTNYGSSQQVNASDPYHTNAAFQYEDEYRAQVGGHARHRAMSDAAQLHSSAYSLKGAMRKSVNSGIGITGTVGLGTAQNDAGSPSGGRPRSSLYQQDSVFEEEDVRHTEMEVPRAAAHVQPRGQLVQRDTRAPLATAVAEAKARMFSPEHDLMGETDDAGVNLSDDEGQVEPAQPQANTNNSNNISAAPAGVVISANTSGSDNKETAGELALRASPAPVSAPAELSVKDGDEDAATITSDTAQSEDSGINDGTTTRLGSPSLESQAGEPSVTEPVKKEVPREAVEEVVVAAATLPKVVVTPALDPEDTRM